MTLIDLQCELEELCERLKDAEFTRLSCEDMISTIEGLLEGHKVDSVDLMDLCGDLQ